MFPYSSRGNYSAAYQEPPGYLTPAEAMAQQMETVGRMDPSYGADPEIQMGLASMGVLGGQQPGVGARQVSAMSRVNRLTRLYGEVAQLRRGQALDQDAWEWLAGELPPEDLNILAQFIPDRVRPDPDWLTPDKDQGLLGRALGPVRAAFGAVDYALGPLDDLVMEGAGQVLHGWDVTSRFFTGNVYRSMRMAQDQEGVLGAVNFWRYLDDAANGERVISREGQSKAYDLLRSEVHDPRRADNLYRYAVAFAAEEDLQGAIEEVTGLTPESGEAYQREYQEVAGLLQQSGGSLPRATEILNNHHFSLGREIVLAAGLNPSDGVGKYFSGALDATVLVLGDPTNLLFGFGMAPGVIGSFRYGLRGYQAATLSKGGSLITGVRRGIFGLPTGFTRKTLTAFEIAATDAGLLHSSEVNRIVNHKGVWNFLTDLARTLGPARDEAGKVRPFDWDAVSRRYRHMSKLSGPLEKWRLSPQWSGYLTQREFRAEDLVEFLHSTVGMDVILGRQFGRNYGSRYLFPAMTRFGPARLNAKTAYGSWLDNIINLQVEETIQLRRAEEADEVIDIPVTMDGVGDDMLHTTDPLDDGPLRAPLPPGATGLPAVGPPLPPTVRVQSVRAPKPTADGTRSTKIHGVGLTPWRRLNAKLAGLARDLTTEMPRNTGYHILNDIREAGWQYGESTQEFRRFLDSIGRLTGLSPDTRKWYFNQWVHESDVASRRTLVANLHKDMFERLGYGDPNLPFMQDVARRFLDQDMHRYSTGRIDKVLVGNTEVSLAVLPIGHGSLLVAAPTMQEIIDAARKARLMSSMYQWGSNGLQAGMSVWRPAVIMRPGFLIRSSADEILAYIARDGFRSYQNGFLFAAANRDDALLGMRSLRSWMARVQKFGAGRTANHHLLTGFLLELFGKAIGKPIDWISKGVRGGARLIVPERVFRAAQLMEGNEFLRRTASKQVMGGGHINTLPDGTKALQEHGMVLAPGDPMPLALKAEREGFTEINAADPTFGHVYERDLRTLGYEPWFQEGPGRRLVDALLPEVYDDLGRFLGTLDAHDWDEPLRFLEDFRQFIQRRDSRELREMLDARMANPNSTITDRDVWDELTRVLAAAGPSETARYDQVLRTLTAQVVDRDRSGLLWQTWFQHFISTPKDMRLRLLGPTGELDEAASFERELVESFIDSSFHAAVAPALGGLDRMQLHNGIRVARAPHDGAKPVFTVMFRLDQLQELQRQLPDVFRQIRAGDLEPRVREALLRMLSSMDTVSLNNRGRTAIQMGEQFLALGRWGSTDDELIRHAVYELTRVLDQVGITERPVAMGWHQIDADYAERWATNPHGDHLELRDVVGAIRSDTRPSTRELWIGDGHLPQFEAITDQSLLVDLAAQPVSPRVRTWFESLDDEGRRQFEYWFVTGRDRGLSYVWAGPEPGTVRIWTPVIDESLEGRPLERALRHKAQRDGGLKAAKAPPGGRRGTAILDHQALAVMDQPQAGFTRVYQLVSTQTTRDHSTWFTDDLGRLADEAYTREATSVRWLDVRTTDLDQYRQADGHYQLLKSHAEGTRAVPGGGVTSVHGAWVGRQPRVTPAVVPVADQTAAQQAARAETEVAATAEQRLLAELTGEPPGPTVAPAAPAAGPPAEMLFEPRALDTLPPQPEGTTRLYRVRQTARPDLPGRVPREPNDWVPVEGLSAEITEAGAGAQQVRWVDVPTADLRSYSGGDLRSGVVGYNPPGKVTRRNRQVRGALRSTEEITPPPRVVPDPGEYDDFPTFREATHSWMARTDDEFGLEPGAWTDDMLGVRLAGAARVEPGRPPLTGPQAYVLRAQSGGPQAVPGQATRRAAVGYSEWRIGAADSGLPLFSGATPDVVAPHILVDGLGEISEETGRRLTEAVERGARFVVPDDPANQATVNFLLDHDGIVVVVHENPTVGLRTTIVPKGAAPPVVYAGGAGTEFSGQLVLPAPGLQPTTQVRQIHDRSVLVASAGDEIVVNGAAIQQDYARGLPYLRGEGREVTGTEALAALPPPAEGYRRLVGVVRDDGSMAWWTRAPRGIPRERLRWLDVSDDEYRLWPTGVDPDVPATSLDEEMARGVRATSAGGRRVADEDELAVAVRHALPQEWDEAVGELPPIPKNHERLYRAELSDEQQVAVRQDYIDRLMAHDPGLSPEDAARQVDEFEARHAATEQAQAAAMVEGRWFGESVKRAQWYAGNKQADRLRYIDVAPGELEDWRVVNRAGSPAHTVSQSKMTEWEIPPEILEQRSVVVNVAADRPLPTTPFVMPRDASAIAEAEVRKLVNRESEVVRLEDRLAELTDDLALPDEVRTTSFQEVEAEMARVGEQLDVARVRHQEALANLRAARRSRTRPQIPVARTTTAGQPLDFVVVPPQWSPWAPHDTVQDVLADLPDLAPGMAGRIWGVGEVGGELQWYRSFPVLLDDPDLLHYADLTAEQLARFLPPVAPPTPIPDLSRYRGLHPGRYPGIPDEAYARVQTVPAVGDDLADTALMHTHLDAMGINVFKLGQEFDQRGGASAYREFLVRREEAHRRLGTVRGAGRFDDPNVLASEMDATVVALSDMGIDFQRITGHRSIPTRMVNEENVALTLAESGLDLRQVGSWQESVPARWRALVRGDSVGVLVDPGTAVHAQLSATDRVLIATEIDGVYLQAHMAGAGQYWRPDDRIHVLVTLHHEGDVLASTGEPVAGILDGAAYLRSLEQRAPTGPLAGQLDPRPGYNPPEPQGAWLGYGDQTVAHQAAQVEGMRLGYVDLPEAEAAAFAHTADDGSTIYRLDQSHQPTVVGHMRDSQGRLVPDPAVQAPEEAQELVRSIGVRSSQDRARMLTIWEKGEPVVVVGADHNNAVRGAATAAAQHVQSLFRTPHTGFDLNLWYAILGGRFKRPTVVQDAAGVARPVRHDGLDQLIDAAARNQRLPSSIVAPQYVLDEAMGKHPGVFQQVQDIFFNQIHGRFMDAVIRQPMWLSNLGDAIEDIAPLVRRHTSIERIAPLDRYARAAGVDRDTMGLRFERAMADRANSVYSEDTLTEVRNAVHHWRWVKNHTDKIAAQNALERTLPFIDDSRQRTMFAAKFRNWFPFWFAEQQFYMRWARTVKLNPKIIRRAQLTMQGAKASGFVSENEYGEPVYQLPGMNLLQAFMGQSLHHVLGLVNINFDPRLVDMAVGGAVLQTLPGFGGPGGGLPSGPAVTVPLNVIRTKLQHTFPELVHATDVLMPNRSEGRGALDQVVPVSVTRLYRAIVADEGDAGFTNYLVAAAAQLEATGHGLEEDSSAVQRERWMDRVRDTARNLALMRWAVGLFAPAPPIVDVAQITGDGGQRDPLDLFQGSDVGRVFIDLLENMPHDQALTLFIELYPDAHPYTVFATESVYGAPLPANEHAADFLIDHEQLFVENPEAAVWLLPNEMPNDQYSRVARSEQFALGLRDRKDLERYWKDIKFAASAEPYFRERDRFNLLQSRTADPMARSLQELEYEQWRRAFLEQHPVFAEEIQSGSAAQRRDRTIIGVTKLLGRDDLPVVDALPGLRRMQTAYLEWVIRDEALSTRTDTASRHQRALAQRQFLALGERLADTHPSAAPYWYSVLRSSIDVLSMDTPTLGERMGAY